MIKDENIKKESINPLRLITNKEAEILISNITKENCKEGKIVIL